MKDIKENYISKNEDFYYIIDDILKNKEFQKLKEVKHHGITRYNHLLRVAYYTYLITKKLNLKYVEATRGALLHDFFSDETKNDSSYNALINHPEYALKNASKYFELTTLEKDIIKTHMFPITKVPPHYKESHIVDIVDDVCSCYEKTYSIRKELKTATTFLFILISLKIKY